MTRYAGRPPFPERIFRLEELAVDLCWSWHPEAREVFRRLDYTLWRATAHNPVRMLWLIAPEKLQTAAENPAFLRIYDRAIDMLDDARAARNTWWSHNFPNLGGQSIAYFSAEFALHQSLPIYAAASASSPEITARRQATSASRSSASASCIRRATFTSTSRLKGGRRKATSG